MEEGSCSVVAVVVVLERVEVTAAAKRAYVNDVSGSLHRLRRRRFVVSWCCC